MALAFVPTKQCIEELPRLGDYASHGEKRVLWFANKLQSTQVQK